MYGKSLVRPGAGAVRRAHEYHLVVLGTDKRSGSPVSRKVLIIFSGGALLRALVHAPPERVIKTFRLAKAWAETVRWERADAALCAKLELLKRFRGKDLRALPFLGFQDAQGISQEQRDDLWMTATYQDEFSNGGKGNYLRFYFVCQAAMGQGSAHRCMSTMQSIAWKRRGHVLYCPECFCKFRAKWGCLVEMEIDGQLYYKRSDCPDASTLDMMAMKAERDVFKVGMSAEQLLAALPKYPPSWTPLVQPKNPGTYRIVDVLRFDSLPVLNWNVINGLGFP